jgi:hypothetical protein
MNIKHVLNALIYKLLMTNHIHTYTHTLKIAHKLQKKNLVAHTCNSTRKVEMQRWKFKGNPGKTAKPYLKK